MGARSQLKSYSTAKGSYRMPKIKPADNFGSKGVANPVSLKGRNLILLPNANELKLRRVS